MSKTSVSDRPFHYSLGANTIAISPAAPANDQSAAETPLP